ncbi:Uncharacterized protein Fot_56772 [Forsythia ovata]|uniref:Uncharacterized protein n=1 Tax=Forsythia ovata TaxID=205694 RepID=A0ABD1P1G4_9LAMI
MVGESAEVVGAGVGWGSSGNKMPTLEEYGTNLTKLAEESFGFEYVLIGPVFGTVAAVPSFNSLLCKIIMLDWKTCTCELLILLSFSESSPMTTCKLPDGLTWVIHEDAQTYSAFMKYFESDSKNMANSSC